MCQSLCPCVSPSVRVSVPLSPYQSPFCLKPFLTHCSDPVLGFPLGVSLLVSCSQHYLAILSLFLNHVDRITFCYLLVHLKSLFNLYISYCLVCGVTLCKSWSHTEFYNTKRTFLGCCRRHPQVLVLEWVLPAVSPTWLLSWRVLMGRSYGQNVTWPRKVSTGDWSHCGSYMGQCSGHIWDSCGVS